MTLHFSQIGLTDDLTFTANPPFLTRLFSVLLQQNAHAQKGTIQKCPFSIIARTLFRSQLFF
jgi:hypothetical protein